MQPLPLASTTANKAIFTRLAGMGGTSRGTGIGHPMSMRQVVGEKSRLESVVGLFQAAGDLFQQDQILLDQTAFVGGKREPLQHLA